jgi:hypothetical protein
LKMSTQNVVFKFHRPSGSGHSQPSAAMHEALMLLSEAEELRPLLAQASMSGNNVSIEVFQTRDGQPLIIHFSKEATA